MIGTEGSEAQQAIERVRASLVALAKDFGEQGRTWNDYTCTDAVQEAYDAGMLRGRDVRACERSYEEGVIGARRRTWCHVWTTAPIDFDSFGTTEIERVEGYVFGGRSFTLRRVIVEPRHVEWHLMRYRSGLHLAWQKDPREPE